MIGAVCNSGRSGDLDQGHSTGACVRARRKTMTVIGAAQYWGAIGGKMGERLAALVSELANTATV